MFEITYLINISSKYILGESKNAVQKEYYVKWQSLPYSDATWEVASLIESKWPQKIKEFKDREGSKRTPSKACRALKYRPKFVQLTEEPEYFGGYDEVCIFILKKKKLLFIFIHWLFFLEIKT